VSSIPEQRSVFIASGLALLLLSVLSVPAWPQSGGGSVRGTARDASQAVIPNVNVVLTNVATGVELRTTSNQVGIFVFPSATPGSYKLEAEFAGMSKYEATVTVQTQQSTTVDIVLQPSGTQTLVEVQDITPIVVTDGQSLGATLERTRIEQLPINGRFIMNLMNSVPGVTFDSEGALRTFGTRRGTHDVVLDGAALTDALYGGGTVGRPPSLESIQEFRVEMNSASAKFTRQTSIVMTTKGGTNEIHGSLFLTNRNNAYGVARARDNFTNTAAKLIRNEWGGSVGGPLLVPKVYDGRNKSFWFFSYEGFKQRTGAFGNYRVPTEAMRNGDFSGLVDGAGTRTTIYDPLTTGADYSRQPFNFGGTLNRIDPSRVSPLMKYIYSVLPLPNIPGVNPLVGVNYTAPNPNQQDQYTWSARFDHRFSDNDLVYGRITNAMATTNRPGAGGVPTLDGFGNARMDTFPNKSLSLNWTRTFSPSFFSETMFSASRSVRTIFSGDPSRRYSTELGLPNPGGQPGYPVINNIGVGTGGGNYFQPVNWNMSYFNYFILDNNSTKLVGKHELQFGVHLRHDQLNYMPQQQRTAGSATFQANTTALYDPRQSTATNRVATLNTGHVAAGAFLGHAIYEVRAAKGMYYMRQNEDALYFQDNWRATNRLTLNMGLRWQFSPYPTDKYNIFSSFDPKTMSIVMGQDLETMYRVGATTPSLVKALQDYGATFITAQEAGLPKNLVKNNWRDIGPHVGFAYRAFDGPKSFVLRGGFSTSYFPVPIYGWNDRMRLNAPFAGFYQNYALTQGAQSPDGLGNWGLVAVPPIVAGQNSANAVDFSNPRGITVGGDSFQAAYFAPSQPSARVHDWNLTAEKEVMRDTVLRVGYLGNRSTHQDSYDDWNAPMPAYTWYMTKRTQFPTGALAQALTRPNPTLPYGNLQEYRRDGWGNSNGMQIEFQRRYSKGIGFQVFYMLVNSNKAAGHGWYSDSSVPPMSSFLPGELPADRKDRMQLLLYARDTTVPKHEIRWNWIADLPFGRGKALAGGVNKLLDAVIGGWQVSGMGRWKSNYFMLPQNIWPTGENVEYYGQKYPIEDCRSGVCRPGYLLWNGYIPAHQINSVDASGKPNGVMGVPSNYKPAAQPLHPYPADYRSRTAATDPNYANYGSNFIWIPLTDTTTPVRFNLTGNDTGSPLHPWRLQPILSTNIWNCDAAMFKSFSFTERLRLRVQADFFNVFNVPGNSWSAGADGIAGAWTNANPSGPRTMQLSARFTW
jgi:hypothetical protein